MDHADVIETRLLALGLMLFFVVGCSSSRRAVGVGWDEPYHHPKVLVAHQQGPPPHAPAHGYRAKNVYRYYPASEVYFDTGRRIYFYIEDGVWESDALLPYRLRKRLGNYETVAIYSDTPYAYHANRYKKRYEISPGQANKNEYRHTY